MSDLAVLGGPAAFRETLHVGRPNIGDHGRMMARLAEILQRRWLTNDGPVVKEFEQEVQRVLGVRHCVATSSGTTALELVARAAGLTGEVIVPAFTFVGTAHALHWQNLRPVFCDIDPETHNVDPARVEELITPQTTGIVGVHLWGRPCNVEALAEIAHRNGLTLLFDAAHAFGCSYRGEAVSASGRASVLSFHATKVVNSMEGGAVVTEDDDLAERVRLMRNFGFSGIDQVASVGTNGKLTEVGAAMGLTSLESHHLFLDANRANYRAYQEGLREQPEVGLITYDDGDTPNRHYIVLEIQETAPLSRDELVAVLVAENVLARRYFFPGCHRMEPYASRVPSVAMPETDLVASRVLVLPTGTAVTTDDVALICDLIRRAFSLAPQIRACLR